MPHAVELEPASSSSKTTTKAHKTKVFSSSKEVRLLHSLYEEARHHYLKSPLHHTMARMLDSKSTPQIKRIVSLGLGTFQSSDRSRRLKQLAVLLAIVEQLQRYVEELEVYAQDPSFSRTDEAFLRNLGIRILATPAPTDLGEASRYIDESTLVYSPFLTLEAYRLLFATEPPLNLFIGDDFDALRTKWPKYSPEREEAEMLSRDLSKGFRRRAIGSDDKFWNTDEKPFPMAMYQRISSHIY